MVQFGSDLTNLKRDFERAKESGTREFIRIDDSLSDDTVRLMEVDEREKKNLDTLRQSHVELISTVDTGASVMIDLKRQRETMERVNNNLWEAGDLYATARGIVSRMLRRDCMMSLLWAAVGGLLLTAIVVIIYYKAVK